MTMHKRHNPTVIEQCSHFNDKVEQPLREKLLELATAAKEEFIADLPGWPEPYGTSDISAIYGYHISGFIPCQLGGFEITELYRSDIDPTYHITKAQTLAMDEAQKHCYECFWNELTDEERAKLEAKGLTDSTYSYSDLEELDKELETNLANEFSDYENEWFEPALLRLEMWVDRAEPETWRLGNDNSTPERVYFQLGLNYRDQPYYRSASDETIFKDSITIEQAMRFTPETFVKYLQDRYEKADV